MSLTQEAGCVGLFLASRGIDVWGVRLGSRAKYGTKIIINMVLISCLYFYKVQLKQYLRGD